MSGRAVIKIVPFFLILHVVLQVVASHGINNTCAEAQRVPLVAPMAWEIYKREAQTKKNMVFSPLGIEYALRMILAGARNETANQLKEILNLFGGGSEIHKQVLSRLAEPGRLRMTNKFFWEQDFKVLKNFMSTLDGSSHIQELGGVDAGTGKFFTKKINRWVKKKIKRAMDIFPEGSFNPLERLSLINSLHFKGKLFKQACRQNHAFNFGRIPMQLYAGHFNKGYNKRIGAKILELPCITKNLSMYMIVPEWNVKLKQIETRLRSRDLLDLESTTWHSGWYTLGVPLFKLEASTNLKDVLNNWPQDGVSDTDTDLCTEGKRPLCASAVQNKVYFEVTDWENCKVRMSRSKSFICNRPFIFLVRDKESKALVLLGRVVKPLGWPRLLSRRGHRRRRNGRY